jgi:hypothetical protein
MGRHPQGKARRFRRSDFLIVGHGPTRRGPTLTSDDVVLMLLFAARLDGAEDRKVGRPNRVATST